MRKRRLSCPTPPALVTAAKAVYKGSTTSFHQLVNRQVCLYRSLSKTKGSALQGGTWNEEPSWFEFSAVLSLSFKSSQSRNSGPNTKVAEADFDSVLNWMMAPDLMEGNNFYGLLLKAEGELWECTLSYSHTPCPSKEDLTLLAQMEHAAQKQIWAAAS